MDFSAALDCDHRLFCSPLVWVYGHRLLRLAALGRVRSTGMLVSY